MLTMNTISTCKDHTITEVLFDANAALFRGHFPNNPVLPGFILIDIVINIFRNMHNDTNREIIKTVISAKFLNQVLPGDCVRFECQIHQSFKDGYTNIKNTANCFVKDSIVAKITVG